MQEPLVSISLVAFNAEAFIRDAIESCLMQEVDFSYEILIHDDASKDGTPQIIREYATKYPDKIIPIIQTENQFSKGTEINAKIVIPRARGKYIAFLEADDYWVDPQKLKNQIAFMESNPDVSMCFTASKRIYPSDPPKKTHIKRYRPYDCVCSPKNVILVGGRLVDMGSAVVRRSVFENVPDWYYCVQIWDINIPLLSLLHGKIHYHNKVTSVYRYNTPGSYTQKSVRDYQKRKPGILSSLELLDGYNQATEYRYNKIIKRKTRLISVGLLLLLNPNDDNFNKYCSRLTLGLKLEYYVFKSIGSYRLWERYRQVMRIFRKIKSI